MTVIPWSFPGKAAINFRNETCGRNAGEHQALCDTAPKLLSFLNKSSRWKVKCRTEYFLSYIIGEMFRTNELFVDSVDLAFVYLFLVRDT